MMLRNLFSSVIEVTLIMSIIIVALLALHAVIKKKLTAKWSCFVWLLIAFRLALPFNIPIPDMAFQIEPPVAKEITVVKKSSDTPNQVTKKAPVTEIDKPSSSKAATQESSSPNATQPTLKPERITIDFVSVAAWIWLIGMFLIAVYQVISYLSIRREIRRFSTPISNQNVMATYEVLKQEMHLKKKIPLKLCKKIATPMLVGFMKPMILLPTVHYSMQECYGILKHECIHHKRHDPLFKLLLMVVQTIHWFNPFVYIMSYFAKKDIELSCDAEVIKKMNFHQRKEYSLTLLNSLEVQVNQKSRLSAAFSEDKRTVKDRFIQIFDTSKKKKGIFALIAIALVVAIGGSLLMFGTREVKQVNDSLTIYVDKYMEMRIRGANMIFRTKFPNVKLNIVDLSKLSYKEYITKIQADIQAENGPDILWADYSNFENIYKSMDAGVFCDLNSMIEQDKDIDLSKFNTTILNAGIYKSKRYVMPLYYQIPYLLTTKDILKKADIDVTKCGNFKGLANEINQYVESKDKKTNAFIDLNSSFLLYYYNGISTIDYENRKVNLDNPQIKEVYDLYKNLYQKETKNLVQRNITTTYDGYDFLSKGESCFYPESMYAPDRIFKNAAALNGINQEPVVLPIKTIDGKLQAEVSLGVGIRNNSKNKKNALEYIKVLLSPQVQENPYMQSGFPVSNETLKTKMIEWTVASETLKLNGDGTEITFKELPQEMYVNIQKDIENIEKVKLYESAQMGHIFEYLQPYFENKQGFNECMSKIKTKMQIYVTE